MRKLIAIMTCRQKSAWVAAQRHTWVRDVQRSGYADVRFFYGSWDNRIAYAECGDEVHLDCPDDYAGIPLKVIEICKWAERRCYDYTMKCDDDVFVVPKRLPSLSLLGDYIGRFRGPYGNVYPVHFASGFSYWMSSRSTSTIAATPWNGDWMDERFVATALARRGIFGHDASPDYLVTGPHLDAATVQKNACFKNGTVFCEYTPTGLVQMYDAMGHLGPVAPSRLTPVQLPCVQVTDEILSASPGDSIPEHKRNRRYYAL